MTIKSFLGSLVSPFLVSEAFWVCKMANGRLLSERDTVKVGTIAETGHPSFLGSTRPFDWSLDLCATGDILKVKELWLICPPSLGNPLGQTARLPIMESGTAFQFKVGYVDGNPGGTMQSRAHQVIGRVNDKVTGACECFLWDVGLGKLGMWNTSVYDFKSWRPEVADIGVLSLDVLGLHLS